VQVQSTDYLFAFGHALLGIARTGLEQLKNRPAERATSGVLAFSPGLWDMLVVDDLRTEVSVVKLAILGKRAQAVPVDAVQPE